MTDGPLEANPSRRFASFKDYFFHLTGHTPPLTITWRRSWSIRAPDFPDDDVEVDWDDTVSSSVLFPPIFSSFGEFARTILGIHSTSLVIHVF